MMSVFLATVLIVNGNTGDSIFTDLSEVIDFQDPPKRCQDYPRFPVETACATGSYLPEYGVAFVCTKELSCYSVTKKGITETSALQEERAEATR